MAADDRDHLDRARLRPALRGAPRGARRGARDRRPADLLHLVPALDPRPAATRRSQRRDPGRNGGALLGEVLAAVRAQTVAAELVVADIVVDRRVGRARALVRREVLPVERFSHGGTRNLLMERTRGEHVAFLTQDALPAAERWLEALLAGFALADDVALVYGPSRPVAGAPVAVGARARRVVRVAGPRGPPAHRPHAHAAGPGRGDVLHERQRGGVARGVDAGAVPGRPVRRGPGARAARCSARATPRPSCRTRRSSTRTTTPPLDQFRRTFDEWRALHEVHGWVQPLNPLNTLLTLQSEVRKDLRSLRGAPPRTLTREGARSVRHWTVRAAGAIAGSRADRLPPRVQRWCSLERRGSMGQSGSSRAAGSDAGTSGTR